MGTSCSAAFSSIGNSQFFHFASQCARVYAQDGGRPARPVHNAVRLLQGPLYVKGSGFVEIDWLNRKAGNLFRRTDLVYSGQKPEGQRLSLVQDQLALHNI